MSYKFRQHMPNFMDFPVPPKAEFKSLDDIPVVQRVKNSKNFKELQYSFRPGYGQVKDEYMLMESCQDGRFYVLGYLDEKPEGLEEWKYAKNQDSP